MGKRKRRIRPTTRLGRTRRTQILKLLRRTRIRKAERETLLTELDALSPYPAQESTLVV
jgi:hypothetical protein